MQNLILVDKNNNQIGTKGKLESHLINGTLHRAFTCILTNNKGEILLTKRSLKKPLWPTFWDLSFSSHPWDGEDLQIAVIRRAKQELGIKIEHPKLLFSYYYQAQWSELFAEHEINHLFITKIRQNKFKPNPEEISNYKWFSRFNLLNFIQNNKKEIVPWILIDFNKIKKYL